MIKLDDAVIETEDLRKSFSSRDGAVEAVGGVTMSVRAGEVFGFLGPNGAGKTTTLRMLTTLLPIEGGRARVAGWDVRDHPEQVRRRIGYVSQLGGADDLASGRENLILQGRLYGLSAAEASRKAAALIDLLDLSEFAERRVRTYSGGQRRRLDVALGIVHEPDVLFLDEPTTGLDPQNRANLWAHLSSLGERGTTIFLTTHYLEEADALCDRLTIIDHGRIVVEGSPQELKRQVAGDTVVMGLRSEEPGQELLAELSSQPYVRELSREDDGALRLYVDEGSAAIPQLLQLLQRRGVGLQALSLAEPSLDDVFLRQTGRKLRDAGAELERAA
jgi:ABC-2 type transport system ATP-binding protein